MHAPSPMALLLIAIVVLVLFGRGKIASLMGEVGKGITAFKKGVNDGTKEIEDAANTTPRDVTPPVVVPPTVVPPTVTPPTVPAAEVTPPVVPPTDKDKV